MVIAISILIFSLVFPLILWLVGKPTQYDLLNQVIYVAIKLPLLFPIGGLDYEFQRVTSRYLDRWWARTLAWPGMAIQRLTTRTPSDDQLEVALTSLRKALWRERVGTETNVTEKLVTYPNYEAVIRELG